MLDDQGGVDFSCDFDANSTASGCLAIGQGVGSGRQPVVLYRAVHRSYDSELTISSSLQGLPFGKNKVFLYEIEKSGIPGKYPAVSTSVDISSQPQTHSKLKDNEYVSTTIVFCFGTQLQKHILKGLLISLCSLGINKFVYCHL